MNEQTGHAGATVIVITHVHFGDLGTLGPLLAARGAQIRYIDLGRELIDEHEITEADLVNPLGFRWRRTPAHCNFSLYLIQYSASLPTTGLILVRRWRGFCAQKFPKVLSRRGN